MNNHTLRKTIIQQRLTLTTEQIALSSKKVLENLTQAEFFNSSQSIACYFSVNHELETHGIIQAIHSAGKSCFIPRILDYKGNIMRFCEYLPGEKLVKNRFGINEPEGKESIEASDLHLILAPLVAFDTKGNRLGMGLGYYDRALANKTNSTIYCGLAYSFQEVEFLEKKSWDIFFDFVITEKSIRKF